MSKGRHAADVNTQRPGNRSALANRFGTPLSLADGVMRRRLLRRELM
ncbi:MAG: hypothetical protein ACKOJG_08105 [Actinomycetota bacterium]